MSIHNFGLIQDTKGLVYSLWRWSTLEEVRLGYTVTSSYAKVANQIQVTFP